MKNFSLWNFGKNLALWLVVAVLLVALFNLFQNSSARPKEPPTAYSTFIEAVDKGQVYEVHIYGRVLAGHFTDGRSFTTNDPGDPNLVQRLIDKKVKIEAVALDENAPSIISILVSWFPLLGIFGIFFYFMRKMQARGGGPPLDGQIRLEQLEAQMRTVTTQLREIQSALSGLPGHADKAPTDSEQHL